MSKLLILDLDDTIFETRTITKESVTSILSKFESILLHKFGKPLTDQIISEFWQFPFDIIAKKYQLDEHVNRELANSIDKANFKFNIRPYEDFEIVKKMRYEKILVTTGFNKLQRTKINCLEIRDAFSEIYIDDILDPKRIFKKGIFTKIIAEKKINKELVFIIGDNPTSELKAGYELGLQTIQVAKQNQKKSKYANYIIHNFNELIDVIHKN